MQLTSDMLHIKHIPHKYVHSDSISMQVSDRREYVCAGDRADRGAMEGRGQATRGGGCPATG